MSKASTIHWIERAPDLYEARMVMPNGCETYVGYVAVSPGHGVWRGYVGVGFTPVGMGPRAVTQRAVEQQALEALRHTSRGAAAGYAS